MYFFSFFIKYYNIIFIIIVFWLGSSRPSGLLSFVPSLLFPYDLENRLSLIFPFSNYASLLTFFVCLIVLFHSCCSHARVFGQILVHEFPFPIAIQYWVVPSFFAKRSDRNGGRVACQKLTIIITRIRFLRRIMALYVGHRSIFVFIYILL